MEEMVSADETLSDAVELAEGVRFLASLGVQHEMHCLVHNVLSKSCSNRLTSFLETLEVLSITRIFIIRT